MSEGDVYVTGPDPVILRMEATYRSLGITDEEWRDAYVETAGRRADGGDGEDED